MKKFNPEKELNKIKNGSKNKILYSIIALLIIISISSTYALYQVRNSNKLVYTVVKPFSNKDITLAVYLGNEPSNKFPEKGKGYYYDRIECDNKEEGYTKASWNNLTWSLTVNTQGPNKCDVYFTYADEYRDYSGANSPELYQGLIPIYYDEAGKIYFADLHKKWYDYDQHEWANAVLVDASNSEIKDKYFQEDGTLKPDAYDKEIPMEDILQMYVWIPRYKYRLWHVEKSGGTDPQEIKIEFESGTTSTGEASCTIDSKGAESCIDAINGNWFTHPAFKFGNTDLTGIWVGKFETSGSDTNVKIIPDVSPIVSVKVNYMFTASRNIEEVNFSKYNLKKEKIDTHMMKNMEWGAMAYLTHSKYGRCYDEQCSEVTINGTSYKTGYANSNAQWYTIDGVKASTTGNIYGIYDTNGGTFEYTMSNMVNSSGNFYSSSSGFTSAPEEKYYDKYTYGTSEVDHKRGHLGDATRETLKTYGADSGGWYGDHSHFPNNTYSWPTRGGGTNYGTRAGTFAFSWQGGEALTGVSFRIVLTSQDGGK